MNTIFLNRHTYKTTFKPERLIFQGVDNAPRAPENFKGAEKQSEAAALNEVASQSPSQIFNDAISAGGAVQSSYQGGTTVLLNLIKVDPLFTGQQPANTTIPLKKVS